MTTADGFPEREDGDLSRAISGMLAGEIERGELPSASWLVVRRGEAVSRGAIGYAVVEPERVPATTETLYDLASLTKPLVTTPLVLRAVAEGRIALDEPVRVHLPELAASSDLTGATWVDLLSHRAGLEAWFPLYVEGCDRDSYLRTILSRPVAYAPRTSVVYSDLGFILLFLALERVWSERFDQLANELALRPAGAASCSFRPDPAPQSRIAATDRGNEKERRMVEERGLSFAAWREGVIRGEVNDGNAFYLGGVSGHAGLFGDAEGVARLASKFLSSSAGFPADLREQATSCQASSPSERRGLGWQLRTDTNPAAPLSDRAFGHTGFTGTSVWVDPVAELVVVLLTNRIHPVARDSRIQEIRRKMNEIVAADYL